MQLSPHDEKIIALQAELENLHKLAKKTPKAPTTPKNDGDKGGNGKGKGDGDKKRKLKPAWMLQPPKEGEKHTKTVEEKVYHWCPKHKSWGCHKPKDCKGKGFVPPNKTKNQKGQQETLNAPQVQLTASLAQLTPQS